MGEEKQSLNSSSYADSHLTLSRVRTASNPCPGGCWEGQACQVQSKVLGTHRELFLPYRPLEMIKGGGDGEVGARLPHPFLAPQRLTVS